MKRKTILTNKNFKIAINLINENGEIFKYFSSITECAEYLSISRFTVKRRIEKKTRI
jgi:DNA invertase Pin-like site-specific DNA recombinase